jgi:DNA adenine methylase
VGGKRQLLETLIPLLPKQISTYCEPFAGGGAMLFHLQPTTAYINDINIELMGVYQAIKNDVESLIAYLQDFKNESDFFYAVRDWDRNKEEYSKLSYIKKAARIIYLNKT